MPLKSALPHILTTIAIATLAGCSSPEDRVARAAERMNKAKNPSIESVRAEGSRLIVRYKDAKTSGLSDDELTRMMSAGLCEIDVVADLVHDGGAIRIELPRNFDYLAIDIDRCDA